MTDTTEASPPIYVLFVFGVCLLAGVVRTLSRWTVVHHTVIMFLFGLLFGFLAHSYTTFHGYFNVDFLTGARLLQVHTLLLPVVILDSLFSMDPRVFLSCSPIAVVTVIFDYILTMCLQGMFVFFFLDFYEVPSAPVKTMLIYLLFGSLTSVTDTSYVVNTFYKMGSYWVLVKLLEIKRVITLVGACVVYIFVVYANDFHYEVGWYNIFIFIVLQFFVCPVLGWLTAQFMIFWLGRLYNDIGVEITVSIAVAYLLYYFGTVNIGEKPMVSAISVVVYALLLNNRRNCFSLGLDTFLQKLMRILAYIVKTVIFTITGFLITVEDSTTHVGQSGVVLHHVLVSFTLYSWCMLMRGFVGVLTAPVLRRCGYKLSWQELSTMAFCNVSGTVCLITAVASCNIHLVGLFYDNRHIQYMLMFHLGVLALIRSLIAGTMFKHVLMILGMRHVSLARYVAMNDALQKIQEQISTSARSYKFDRFLADADWETVYQFTNFDNPYKDISRYAGIGQAMNLDSEHLGDIRLNLLHAKKMSFWRQYEQGLLSLRALRILLEECYLAEWKVTTTSYDIGDQIRKHYEIKARGMFAVIEALKLKFERMQEIRRLIIEHIMQNVTGKWKTMMFKIGLHVIFEVVFIIFVIITSAASVSILVYESSCSDDWHSSTLDIFFYEIDIAFMVFISVYITLKFIIFKWRYLVLFGSYFNCSLVIIGWIDVGLHSGVLSEPSETCAELIRTQWLITAGLVLHKMFLIYRCMRLIILIQDKTYIIVHAMKKRMLLKLQLGYDVGKAYVYCKEDIHKTAGEFINKSSTLEEIRRELQSSRVQLMRELATVQKKYPGIVVSVKSQEACRRILNVAKETVNQLQRNGRVDASEADMLDEMIKLRLKRLNKIPAQIVMPSVDMLVRKLAWVNGDETLERFLHFNSKLFNMAEGESVDFDSDSTAGLYILVSGLIRVNWTIGEPYGPLLQSSHVDSDTSMHSTKYGKMLLHDYMTTGSTFGELALLTENPVAIDAVCETTVLMYHIPYESIKTALDWIKEPSLEWRLWQIAAVRLSIPLLKALPSYYNSSLEDLKILTDHGTLKVQHLEIQVEDGTNEDTFNLARYNASHVILVHGTAKKSGETFTGPIIIPPDNDDLVFSSVFSDVYVLYVVPHRTAVVTLGTVLSHSASEISTVIDASKEASTQMSIPRTPVPKKRGRKVSVSAAAALKQHFDRPMQSSPLRFLDEEFSSEKVSVGESNVYDKEQKEIGETSEDQLTRSLLFTPAASSAPPSKHGSSAESPPSYRPTPQTIRSVEKVEPVKKELIEVPVSSPKEMVLSQQTAPVTPMEPEKPKETEPKQEIATRDESTQVDVVPRRSSSEVIRRSPYTEAWKFIKPQINVTIGGQKPSTQQTSTTPNAGGRGAATTRAGPAAGKEHASSTPSTTRPQVTDTSTTKPTTDSNMENKNVNNSINNNNNNNNALQVSRSRPTIRLGEDIEDRRIGAKATSSEISEQTEMTYRLGDETSDTSIEDGMAPEVNQSVYVSSLKMIATRKSFDDHDDDRIDWEPSTFDLPSRKATSTVTHDSQSWKLDAKRPLASFAAGSNHFGDKPSSRTLRQSHTVYHVGNHASKVLPEEVTAEPRQTDVIYHTVTKNAALFTNQLTSQQLRSARSAHSKAHASKVPDTTTFKPSGRNAANRPRGTTARQPYKNESKLRSSTKDSRTSSSSRIPPPARDTTLSSAVGIKTKPAVEKHGQSVIYVEPYRPPSSKSQSSADDGTTARGQNRSYRRGVSSAAKPASKPADTRGKTPATVGMATSKTPAAATKQSDTKNIDDNDYMDST